MVRDCLPVSPTSRTVDTGAAHDLMPAFGSRHLFQDCVVALVPCPKHHSHSGSICRISILISIRGCLFIMALEHVQKARGAWHEPLEPNVPPFDQATHAQFGVQPQAESPVDSVAPKAAPGPQPAQRGTAAEPRARKGAPASQPPLPRPHPPTSLNLRGSVVSPPATAHAESDRHDDDSLLHNISEYLVDQRLPALEDHVFTRHSK